MALRELLQRAGAEATVAMQLLSTSSGGGGEDVGTAGYENIPSTAAIVGGVVGGLSILTLGLAAALVFAVARIYGWTPFRGKRWGWDTGAGGADSKKGDVETAIEMARPGAHIPSIVTTRLMGGSTSGSVEPLHSASSQASEFTQPGTAMATAASSASPLRKDASWRDCLIEPEQIQILRRRDGRPWVLGGGAFGQVYKALYDGVQVVAAKVLTGLADERVFQSFVREASILRDMRDRNVIQFVGICMGKEEEGQPDEAMMIQEFAEAGMPLGDMFHALKWRDQAGRRVYGWYARGKKATSDVARGLHYLHSHKIVHLDLKSSNVLLARDGTCKLADVGLARSLMSKAFLTSAGTMGTFAWSAPEVLTGQQVSTAADIYSLGIVLWEVVTGEIPQRGTMRNPKVPEECPQEVLDLIDRCTSQDPAARPTAKQIVQMLEGLPAGTPSRAEERGAPLRSASIGPWRNQLPQQVSKYMPNPKESPMGSDDMPPPYPPGFGAPPSGPFGSSSQELQRQSAGVAAAASDTAGQEAPAAASPRFASSPARSGGGRRANGGGSDEVLRKVEEEREQEQGMTDIAELEEAQRLAEEEGGPPPAPPLPTLRLEDLPPLSSQDKIFM